MEIASAVPDWEARLLRSAATGDSLSQLTLGMAHELNNLVGGISALSEIYLQGIESGLPIKDGLGLINNSALRLQLLLRQLTGLNRRPEGNRDYVNIADLIRSELSTFAHVLPKSVRIEPVLPDEELAALIDETALRQLLLNLVLNLRDALGGERAAGTLRITIARLAGDQPWAEIRFSGHLTEGRELPASLAPDDSRWLNAQVRSLDSVQSAQELGGIITASEAEIVFSLPLIA